MKMSPCLIAMSHVTISQNHIWHVTQALELDLNSEVTEKGYIICASPFPRTEKSKRLES